MDDASRLAAVFSQLFAPHSGADVTMINGAKLSSLIFLTMSALPVWSETLSIPKQIYDVGETLVATVSVADRGRAYSVRFAPVEDWDELKGYPGDLLSWPRYPGPYVTEFSVPIRPPIGYDGRAYYYIALYENDREIQSTRREVFLQDILPPFDESLIDWTFEAGATLFPGEAVNPRLMDSSPEVIRKYSPERSFEFIRLGRQMPGGAVEVDHMGSNRAGLSAHSPPLPIEGLVVIDRKAASDRVIDARTVVSPDDILIPGSKDYRHFLPTTGDDARKYAVQQLAPIGIGNFVARLRGRYGAILAERQFQVRLPDQAGTLVFDSEDEDVETPPNARVELHPSITQATVETSLVDDFGVLRLETDLGGISSSDEPEVRTYRNYSPYEVGRYETNVYALNLLLDRKRFNLQHDEINRYWPINLDPPVTRGDYIIEIEAEQHTVFGQKIAFAVVDEDSGEAPASGALLAALYFKGHYTYGCTWRKGYYTGTTALIDADGRGVLAAPGEPGRYEIRVFRPRVASAGQAHAPVSVPTSHIGSTLQTIATAALDVVAPRAKGVLSTSPPKLKEPIEILVEDPGPEFRGHQLEIQLWYSGAKLPGGSVTAPMVVHPYPLNGDPRRFYFQDGTRRQRIGTYPFTATVAPVERAGDFEVRLYDLSTGLFVARQPIKVRLPNRTPPRHSAYGKGISDWPGDADDLRSVPAWRVPTSQCADPVFETPPVLQIVNWLQGEPEDYDDDDYRPVDSVWPGYPYLLQATFTETPAEDSYLVKVDGQRQVEIFRSQENLKVYRSQTIYFDPSTQDQMEGEEE